MRKNLRIMFFSGKLCGRITKLTEAHEEIRLSDTYREVLLSLSLVREFNSKGAEELSKWVRFRNIISHEYLDIKWASIKRFIGETEQCIRDF